MELIKALELFNSLLVCVSVVLISIPKIKGVYLMTLAQAGWIWFAFMKGQQFFLFQGMFLFIANLYAIYSWRKKGVGCNSNRI